MAIAVIGWGSLIYDLGSGDRALRVIPGTKWRKTGPPLPIEFCDISDNGRLTLLIDGNAANISTYWIEHADTDVKIVCANLARRELTGIDNIRFVSKTSLPEPKESAPTKAIREWLNNTSCEAVVWTDIKSRFQERFGQEFSTSNAINYLKTLTHDEKRTKALDYIRKAPPQTDTEVRRLAQKEFVLQKEPHEFWTNFIEE